MHELIYSISQYLATYWSVAEIKVMSIKNFRASLDYQHLMYSQILINSKPLRQDTLFLIFQGLN